MRFRRLSFESLEYREVPSNGLGLGLSIATPPATASVGVQIPTGPNATQPVDSTGNPLPGNGNNGNGTSGSGNSGNGSGNNSGNGTGTVPPIVPKPVLPGIG
jgi:hypothetical protein